MIKVNTNELKNHVDHLKNLIEQYESIELNIFNQLNDSCKNWNDGNSLALEQKIPSEKKETVLLLDYLKQNKNIYSFVYSQYNTIGKKIVCELGNKGRVLNLISEIENQINNIVNQFYWIDGSFYYPEYQTIMVQRNNIIYLRTIISNYRSNITQLYQKIEDIEKEINARISKLDKVRINSLDYIMK